MKLDVICSIIENSIIDQVYLWIERYRFSSVFRLIHIFISLVLILTKLKNYNSDFESIRGDAEYTFL